MLKDEPTFWSPSLLGCVHEWVKYGELESFVFWIYVVPKETWTGKPESSLMVTLGCNGIQDGNMKESSIILFFSFHFWSECYCVILLLSRVEWQRMWIKNGISCWHLYENDICWFLAIINIDPGGIRCIGWFLTHLTSHLWLAVAATCAIVVMKSQVRIYHGVISCCRVMFCFSFIAHIFFCFCLLHKSEIWITESR